MSDPTPTPTTTSALQAALQGEYAAVFGYGQAAGPLRGTDLATASSYLDAHRARRDRLTSLVLDQSAVPTPAAAEYAVPPSATARAGRTVLAGIESRLCATYADLVAASTGPTRALAVTALQESAARSARWGAAVPVFPGLAER